MGLVIEWLDDSQPDGGEFYALAKRGFRESLEDAVGVATTIEFSGVVKKCISSQIYDKSQWERVGLVPDIIVEVDMLDDDFNDFVAIGLEEAQSTMLFEGTQFKLVGIKQEAKDPTVHLKLSVDK